MPNCFTLTRVGETHPSTFARVDEELCRHFGEPVHETKYFAGWFDFEGMCIAMGRTPDQIIGYAPERADIIEYLRTYYIWDAWCER